MLHNRLFLGELLDIFKHLMMMSHGMRSNHQKQLVAIGLSVRRSAKMSSQRQILLLEKMMNRLP